jgi:hypothetical protein
MTEDNAARPSVPSPASNGAHGRNASVPAPIPPPIDTRAPSLVSYIPAGWLAVVMILALRGLVSAFPFAFGYDLPGSVMFLIYGGGAASVVTLLWGLYVLGLAFRRSPRFRRQFAAWQIAQIAWLLIREAYVQVTPEFVFSVENTAMTALEIAIGLFCLYLVRGKGAAAAFHDRPATEPQPLFVSIIAGILGVIVGGALGFAVGLGAGILIAEVTEMSCFEGACGFFAFFLGLGGTIIGAVAGGIFAVLRVNRRPQPTI